MILRLYETWNRQCRCRLHLSLPIADAAVCDMIEEREQKLSFDGQDIELTFRPFEIKTIKLYFHEKHT